MQAVILCGGKGTRLGELTKDKPKCLLEVGGRPILEWIIGRLDKQGFDDIQVCAGHLGDQLVRWVVLNTHAGCYDIGDPDKCGTGGALRHGLDRLEDKFLVTYGDTYLPFDYAEPMRELVGRQDCDAVMTVYREDHGNVWDDGGAWALSIYDGRNEYVRHTEYGAIAMTRKIVEGIPYNLTIPLNRVLNGYAEVHRVRIIEAKERYHTINTPEELAETDAYMRTL